MVWVRHHEVAGWWPMGIGLLFCIVLVAVVVWLVVRAVSQGSGAGPGSGAAEELLRHRFAAGEIDDEEYAKRLEVLRRK